MPAARKPTSRTPKSATRPPTRSNAIAKPATPAGKRPPAAAKRAPAAAKRTPTAGRRATTPAKRTPAKRTPARPRKPRPRRSFTFEQRHADVVGLGLVAVGVFLTVILYTRSDGGRAGHAITTGLGWLLGEIRYAAPPTAVGIGAVLVLRPVLPSVRPFRTGTILLFCALTLALAAGTFGIGPAGVRHGYWQAAFFERHGGILGEAEFWAAAHLVGQSGADILAVFLALAGLTLLTGGGLAVLVRAGGTGVLDLTRTVRISRPAALDRRARHADPFADDDPTGDDTPPDKPDGPIYADAEPPLPREMAERIVPPEPLDQELVVRATHVEAPPIFDHDGEFTAVDDPQPDPADPVETDDPIQRLHDAAAADSSDPRDPPDRHEAQLTTDDLQEPGPAREIEAHELTPQGRYRGSVTDDPDFVWRLPKPSVLTRSTAEQSRPDTAGQEKVAAALIEALGHFGVAATVVGTVAGPHITRYELRLAPGIKVAKVAQLKDDLAYALAATDIRILAPIPGKQAVGVEVPNARRRIVRLGDVFQEPPADWSPLTVWLGKDVAGRAIGADLAKMPHLLVAGTTGAGKSGAVNAMLSSILLRATPHEVRLVLVDPKQVELNHYESIPHLLTPVITSPKMAANALANLVREMETRYGIMSLARTRSLPELNKHREKRGDPPLPYILCVIDELADLMMVAHADVEDSIIRLAQKARAVGIHLVLATQSPRVDVITGMIKANVPSRIAFAVSSQTDSRVILDQNGAESLLGAGDMLFSPVGTSRLQRIQGAYIDEPQILALTDFWRAQGEPEMREEMLEEVESDSSDEKAPDEFDPDEDPLLADAIMMVAEMGTASTSMLQRRLRLGYTRAGRLIDMLERRGIISGYEGSKPRQVLVAEADVPRVLAALSERGPAAGGGGGAGAGGGSAATGPPIAPPPVVAAPAPDPDPDPEPGPEHAPAAGGPVSTFLDRADMSTPATSPTTPDGAGEGDESDVADRQAGARPVIPITPAADLRRRSTEPPAL
ncbi:MAG TPA: DNA translocase FtsK [Solirubrobacteraceae bacterium]|jgi:S-DNA-T family DNA segregation ATPase FtsK/SpoIIIE|nr:DNA translocase FtsK [Solirubrobacteraceae bacterium]